MAFSEQELQIIKWGTQNGKSRAEVEGALKKFRTGYVPPEPVEAEPSFVERVASDIQGAGEKVQEAIAGEGEFAGQSPIRQGVEATAKAFTAVPQVAMEALPKEARSFLGGVGEKIGEGFKFLTDKLASTKLFKEIGDLEAQGYLTKETAPELYAVKEALGTTAAGGEIAGDILTVEGGVRGVKATQKILSETAKKTQTALEGVVKTGQEGIQEAVSKTLNPSDIMQRVARISKGKQAKFETTAGESVGEYLVKRGIFGDIDDLTTQLYKRFTQSKGVADDALAKLKGTFKPTPVKTVLDELFARETRVSSPGALSRDFKRVRELVQKYNKEGLSMSEINEVKRLYERNVKLDYLKQNLPESVARANNLDSALREWQFSKAKELGLKNLPDINKETRLAKQLLDDLGAEYAGSAGNNAITLTDWIILAGGDPTAIATFLVKKGFSSKGIQSEIAKRLAPEANVGIPKAEFGEPIIDDYIKFLRSTEVRTTK